MYPCLRQENFSSLFTKRGIQVLGLHKMFNMQWQITCSYPDSPDIFPFWEYIRLVRIYIPLAELFFIFIHILQTYIQII